MNISKALKALESTASDVIALCNAVKKIEDLGEYSRAAEEMGEWWLDVGKRPSVDGFSTEKKAAILARVGALSGWLGSARQIAGSQEKAKDLISEAANLFEEINSWEDWAETRSDLAVCYWREGAFDEARVILDDVLGNSIQLSSELKAKILLRSVNVEISTCHYVKAEHHIDKAKPLVEKYGNDLLLGKLYFHHALIFHYRGEDENKPEYITFAIEGYNLASDYYKKAEHNRYVAMSENNIGNAYRLLGDFQKTHVHLDNALRRYEKLKDKGRAALVYDNKARTFLEQNRLSDAQLAALTSVNMLREGGENSTLAESLTTLAIVLSRGGDLKEAMSTFDEAKKTALSVGDTESAGNALLTYIEELQPYLTPIVIRKLYLEADDLLKNSPKIGTISRLQKIARKQLEINSTDALFKSEKFVSWKNFSLPGAVHTFESEIILKAINDAGGRVTKAARLLGMPHQSLSIILHSRHKDLKQYCIQRKSRRDGKAKAKTH
ncbi:MAG TPA: tetratricopeptide repeat protein [Pyrinomonadaceae bacterium]|jgi:tetratricopeptide (TPR) repeat protein|nr:tetratricopeptide repeat protein [Pyrinomonadaceae bacterium]